jgi:malonyl-CoA O-methyltransferase
MNVADAFGRAVQYDAHAAVQWIVAQRLAERIAALELSEAPRILEIGCGTGFLGLGLIDRWPDARWTMTDIAPAMIDRARARFAGHDIAFAVMDGEAPTLAGPFDLICSSLTFQWFADLAGAVTRLRGLLAPGGRIAFTTLAAGSFLEWRRAHKDFPAGTPDYPSRQALAALGLDVSIETIPMVHVDAREFLRSVKGIGASIPRAGHRPLTPGQLRSVMEGFEASGCTASYAVATCIAGQPGEEARS